MTDTTRRPDTPPPAPPAREEGDPQGSSAIRLAMLVLGVAWLGFAGGLSWLLIVAAIVIMIFLHELGHFLTARAAGMKCTEFFIGFGPRIWSFQRGETEYGVKAIPAGAYVKVIGMTNLEEVDPADEDRTYRQKSYWRRMSVAVAGSAMHFAIALVGLYVMLVGFGMSEEDHWEVGALASTQAGAPGPAESAGLRVGDEVVAVDGRAVETFNDLRGVVVDRDPGDQVVVEVARDDGPRELTVTLGDNGAGRGFLGISPSHPRQTANPIMGIPRAVGEFGSFSWQSLEALGNFFSPSGLSSFVGLAVDQADGGETTGAGSEPVAVEDDPNANRVLSIYGAARLGSQAADLGASSFIAFIVLINIFIGIFNLVPLLPLDGGHVAVATYERIRELLAHRKERYHADVAKLMPLTYVVVFVLVSVGLVALYLDISNPVDFPN